MLESPSFESKFAAWFPSFVTFGRNAIYQEENHIETQVGRLWLLGNLLTLSPKLRERISTLHRYVLYKTTPNVRVLTWKVVKWYKKLMQVPSAKIAPSIGRSQKKRWNDEWLQLTLDRIPLGKCKQIKKWKPENVTHISKPLRSR